MKLYVVRHGLTDFNIQGVYNGLLDEDINKIGIQQIVSPSAPPMPPTITGIYLKLFFFFNITSLKNSPAK